jgi:D-tagatose-1,6-bisphosphate aldolase subunit GatZ/KbaZ
MSADWLRARIAANLKGEAVAVPSWCTAHPETLTAIFAAYREDRTPILIEATCNQVNQEGGYSGLTPEAFRAKTERLAQDAGIDPARLILGGDHLGPNPWRGEPAGQAMAKAKAMVAAYAQAGYSKLHLDASMACAGEGPPSEDTIAHRAAELAEAAEATGRVPLYAIGTEVPPPGGEAAHGAAPSVTSPEAARAAFELHRDAFARRGLQGAFARIVALVAQPGVEFGNEAVIRLDEAKAKPLAEAARHLHGAAFEAHSTDYQGAHALRGLARLHFAVLKVGPELTFAYRQAMFALERAERAMAPADPSRLTETLLACLRAEPALWRAHVAEGPREEMSLLYGLSDRVRYVWPRAPVQAALARLRANLAALRPPLGLLAEALGETPAETPAETLAETLDPARLPETLPGAMVGRVVGRYRAATGA